MTDLSTTARDHALHVYGEERSLATTVASFLEPAFPQEQAIIAIATRAHLSAVEQRLRTLGNDVDAARRAGRYVALDASDVLPRLMHNGLPSRSAFESVIATPVGALAREYGDVRAFGELVNMLWQDGKRAAALQLEDLWNELLGYAPLSLICGYRKRTIGGRNGKRVDEIVATHSSVTPTDAF